MQFRNDSGFISSPVNIGYSVITEYPALLSGITCSGDAGGVVSVYDGTRLIVKIPTSKVSTYFPVPINCATNINVSHSGEGSYSITYKAASYNTINTTTKLLKVVQQSRKSTLASARRIRMRENPRVYLIVRNMSPVNVAQVAFTSVLNNDRNPPSTGFTDINPSEEWYEQNSNTQVWYRPKVDGAEVIIEIETYLAIT